MVSMLEEPVFPFDDRLPHAAHDDLGPATFAREIVRKLGDPLRPALDEELAGHVPAQMLLEGEGRELLNSMLP